MSSTSPGEEYEVRRATEADLPELEAIVERSIHALAPAHFDDAQIASALRHLYGVDTQLLRDGTYYAVVAGDRAVACGGWSWRRTPFGSDDAGAVRDAGERQPGRDAAVVRAFFVDPGWTRRGLGRRILSACETAAREAGFDRFELTATPMGRVFYEACGYREVKPVDVQLPDGQVLPHLLMTKP